LQYVYKYCKAQRNKTNAEAYSGPKHKAARISYYYSFDKSDLCSLSVYLAVVLLVYIYGLLSFGILT